jgi:hypothetical protein
MFCGKPGRSKEHHWGKWINEYLPAIKPNTSHLITRLIAGGSALAVRDGPLTRQGSLRAQQIKGPCKICNNTWMNRAVGDAKPLIIRLIQEGPWALSVAERLILARWAIIKTMVYEMADVETQSTPERERRSMVKDGALPTSWAVLLAGYNGERWREMENHRGYGVYTVDENGIAERDRAHNSLFTIGKTAINTMRAFPLHGLDIPDYARHHGLDIIWPIFPTQPYPSTPVLNDPAMDRIATALGGGDYIR